MKFGPVAIDMLAGKCAVVVGSKHRRVGNICVAD
jgi:hypothetical protein